MGSKGRGYREPRRRGFDDDMFTPHEPRGGDRGGGGKDHPLDAGFDRGVEILTMTILGGIHGLMGPISGAVILTLLPELLRSLADFRNVVNGLILVVIVLFLPRGLWDPARLRALFVRGRG